MNDGDSDYKHLLSCCDQLGIPNVRASIDKMIALDFIIVNEDTLFFGRGYCR